MCRLARVFFSALSTGMALLLVALASSAALAEGGRASGVVVDEENQPVTGLRLRLVTEAGEPAPVAPIEVKKGRFAIPAVPPGPHRIEVADGGFAIIRFEIEMRGGGGVRLGEMAVDVPSNALPPTFEVFSSQRADIKLVVTRATGAGLPSTAEIQAARESSAELKKLNDLFTRGDMQALLAEADRVLAANPDLGGAHYLRGVALWKSGKAAEAVPALRRAFELAPDQPGIDGVLGAVLLDASTARRDAGRDEEARAMADEAVDAFTRQLAATPGDKGALTNRVIALERAGRPEEAVTALEALLAAAPEENRAYLRLGEILTELGRNEEALSWLEKAPVQNAETAVRMYNAAVPLYNGGSLELAAEAMRKAIAFAPEVPHPHLLLGQALIGLGDLQEADAELKEFLRLAPDDPEAAAARLLVRELGKQQ